MTVTHKDRKAALMRAQAEMKAKLTETPPATPKPTRKCRACGRDPRPNWYYCKTCLSRISNYVHIFP